MNGDIDKINDYVLMHTTPEDDVLYRLNRETHLTTVYPGMISGPLQGKLLEFISCMIRPARILEIGMFTGYSAVCLARGLAPGGILHTIDVNDELADMAQKYFAEAGLGKSIVIHTGDARDIIPQLDEIFDLVFLDGNKMEYLEYYRTVFPRVRTGGFILADNVLWSGKVLPGSVDVDKETVSLREFNEFVTRDKRVEKLMLPVRDGLYLIHKRGEG